MATGLVPCRTAMERDFPIVLCGSDVRCRRERTKVPNVAMVTDLVAAMAAALVAAMVAALVAAMVAALVASGIPGSEDTSPALWTALCTHRFRGRNRQRNRLQSVGLMDRLVMVVWV